MTVSSPVWARQRKEKLFKLIEKKLQGKTDYALAVEYMDNE